MANARTLARRGWLVVAAGMGINLALGVLYSWSVVAKTLTKEWGWSAGTASLPYAVAVGVFALTMVFAGRAQDLLGPRKVATAGGAMTGLGLMAASLAGPDSAWVMIVGFGLLAGAGIGLGYAAATPAAVKWFPPERKGLVTGIVVSGFGLASVYIAPTTTWLLGDYGVRTTFLALGAAFLVTTVVLAQALVDPPKERSTEDAAAPAAAAASASSEAVPRDYEWHEMIHTRSFHLLWLMYAFSAFAGLMIIGHMARIATVQAAGVELGFLLVAVLAVGNALGRVVAGMVSDRLGGLRTMLLVFVAQAVMMGLLWLSSTPLTLVPVATMIGFCYGANLSLFPSTTAGFFGTKNLGVNYGLVFTAWGVGGVFGSMTAGAIVDSTQTYAIAYAMAAVLCAAAGGITFFTRPPGPGSPQRELVPKRRPEARLGGA